MRGNAYFTLWFSKTQLTYRHQKDNSCNLPALHGLPNPFVVNTNERMNLLLCNRKDQVTGSFIGAYHIEFGKPCYSEKLCDVSFFELKIVDK